MEKFITYDEYMDLINEFRSIYQELDKPIIPDAIDLLKKCKSAKEFKNKKDFEKFLNSQKYFSASYSHCYYSLKDLKDSYSGKKTSAEDCILLFETGHLLVAVWDDKNSIGYILPSEDTKQYIR